MSDLVSTDEVNSEDLPIWNKNTLPANATLIVLVDEQNFDFGGTIQAAYRLPIERIVANNSTQGSVYTLTDLEAVITVPANTVVPAYVESFDPFSLKRSQASSPTTEARFLIIGTNPNVDGGYLVRSSGYHVFNADHNYLVGQTYYLSDSTPGGVTNIPPSDNVQPLFYVVDQRTIQVTIGA